MLEKKVSWDDFKIYVNDNHIFPNFIDNVKDYYEVYAIKGSFVVKTTVEKTIPENSDQIEFEGLYKSKVDETTGKISTMSYENLQKDILVPIILDPRVNYMYIKNNGTSDVDLFINSDDFFTLETKVKSIKIPVFGQRDIKIMSKSNGGNVQIIAWGIE